MSFAASAMRQNRRLTAIVEAVRQHAENVLPEFDKIENWDEAMDAIMRWRRQLLSICDGDHVLRGVKPEIDVEDLL